MATQYNAMKYCHNCKERTCFIKEAEKPSKGLWLVLTILFAPLGLVWLWKTHQYNNAPEVCTKCDTQG